MLFRCSRGLCWRVAALVLTGGAIFQTASCSALAANAAAGLTASIFNELIRSLITESLGLTGGFTGF